MKRFRNISIIGILIICCGLFGCTPEDNPLGGGSTSDSGSIYGCVTDFATGDPVSNANVQLRPSGETTLTGYDGMYGFLDIPDGNYSITVSKAEYSELIDDYVIEVKNGKRMRRDVQIEKLPTSLRITDMNGSDISVLDFGADASIAAKSFNIFNNGTVSISCQLAYSCNWISSVSSIPTAISPGQTVPVTVSINRALLSTGQNTTILTVSSNNGSAELIVKAASAVGNPPEVQMSSVNSVTATSALCTGGMLNDHGGTLQDCGFCYSTSSSPSLNDHVVRLGPCTGTFSFTINDLNPATTYHIKAFATTNLGTGYSSESTFSTVSGLPTCGATTITKLDPTTVRGQSTASATNGYRIIEKGFCWSINNTPTINDHTISCGFDDGSFSGYLSSLQPNTTYRVRAYATSELGTSFGPEVTFTSLSGLATVTTTTATIIGYEVKTGGNVTDDSGTVIIDEGVCYGSSPDPDLSPSFQHTYDGGATTAGPFTSYIPKPMSSGYLYIRAYATTRYGTAYGNQVSIYIP